MLVFDTCLSLTMILHNTEWMHECILRTWMSEHVYEWQGWNLDIFALICIMIDESIGLAN